jgi:hypothetical protein
MSGRPRQPGDVPECAPHAHIMHARLRVRDAADVRSGGILKEIADAAAGKGRSGDEVDWIESPLGKMARWRESHSSWNTSPRLCPPRPCAVVRSLARQSQTNTSAGPQSG